MINKELINNSFLHNFTKNLSKIFIVLSENIQPFEAKPIKSVAKGLWHEYDLPYIGISDEDPKLQDNYFDGYLGMYAAIDKNWEKEGRIVLFSKPIKRVAEEYSTHSGILKEESLNNIIQIVLYHEIGHWIFHYANIENFRYNKFYNEINNDLHEAIAQFFVKEAIKNDQKLKDLFNWLCSKQSQIYNNHLEGTFDGIITLLKQINETYLDAEIEYWKNNLDEKSTPIERISSSLSKKQFPKTFEEYNKFIFDKRGRIISRKLGL